ncbi:transglutaminase-like domain-containing protein, partial [Singulisphaera rosea]
MRRTRRGPRLALALGLLIVPLAAASSGRAQDSWDAVYLSGTKIGHVHTFIEKVNDRGRDLLRVRVDMELQFKRLKDNIKLETRYGTIETPTGEVLRIDTRTVASRQEMRTSGSAKDGKMTLTMEGGGQKQVVTIPWSPEVRGPYAAEQSLSRSPIKPGETRELLMYIPDLNKVCNTKLVARGPEDVLLGDGKRSLLHIDQIVTLEGKVLPECGATLWLDPEGQVLKSRTDLLGGMESYRTTEEGAKAGSNKVPEFNLIAASIIKIGNKIDKPEARHDIVYRVTLKDDDPSKVIPRDRRQTIRSTSGTNTAILEVKTAGPNEGPAGSETVDDQYLRPNALVTSRDPNVVRLAQEAVA